MITVESFAQGERQLGKSVHLHDGVWWVKTAPFYFKPILEFHPIALKSAKPHPWLALMGYSHQVADPSQATRHMKWNILQGDDLRHYSLERLPGKKRNQVRQSVNSCRVEQVSNIESLLEEMKIINISQALRFEASDGKGDFLPPAYYERNTAKWRQDMLKIFRHPGHWFMGAFVADKLAAYVDLIQIEDTWMFGAVKSRDDYLSYRPVDALYFTILIMASQCQDCNRVVNGGGDNERETLTHFKSQFLLKPMVCPYYSRTLLPLDKLRKLRERIQFTDAGNLFLQSDRK